MIRGWMKVGWKHSESACNAFLRALGEAKGHWLV